ncbi:MAG: acetyl-CoA carboxylase biotin carboxyl carrier protein [Armatimonadetes bacterium]|nr:acetyl-CoA carboxylase biotin carboxyl carrier protein [Armatimonadota bacterium]
MSEIQKQVTELAQMMEEFGLDKAKFSTAEGTVEFDRNPPSVAAAAVASPVVPSEPAKKAAPARATPAAPKGMPLSSPMMGIYYSSPSPGSAQFVKEGDVITGGQVVGLVEAMKVFNEITAPMAGTVLKLIAKNGDLIQPGEPLMFIG